MANVWSVVVAGGSGSRFGLAKQFAPLGGKPVVEWAVSAARGATAGVVLVVPADATGQSYGADVVVPGGRSRSESVRCGLEVLPPTVDIVVVHDAVRPLAGTALFAAVLAAVGEDAVDGAITALEVTDTLKRVGGTPPRVLDTIGRDAVVSVQTPQAFRLDVLRRAHAEGGEATDDAALVEAVGGTVRVVPGDPRNLKITTPADLAVATRLLEGE